MPTHRRHDNVSTGDVVQLGETSTKTGVKSGVWNQVDVDVQGVRSSTVVERNVAQIVDWIVHLHGGANHEATLFYWL